MRFSNYTVECISVYYYVYIYTEKNLIERKRKRGKVENVLWYLKI